MHLSNEFFGILPLYPSVLGEKEAIRFCRSRETARCKIKAQLPMDHSELFYYLVPCIV